MPFDEYSAPGPQTSMSNKASKGVIYVAVAANGAIAIAKFVAAAFTGSAGMFAEAFHSVADLGNELLLLFGIKRSERPADELHPYGYGKALYFYSLLVAVYIFGVGAGFAIHHGITHLRDPQIPDHPGWNYAVLAFAAVFEGYSWRVSYRELRSRKGSGRSTWQEIIASKDPTVFTVFLEDSADLLGGLLAFLGIFLGRLWNNPYLDPAASIAIGVVLAGLAIFLGRESGALLVGERTNLSRIQKVREIITQDPSVEKVGDLLTMQLGPEQVLLTVEIQFRRDLDLAGLEATIDRIEARIHEQEPTIQRIFIEAESFKPRSSPHAV